MDMNPSVLNNFSLTEIGDIKKGKISDLFASKISQIAGLFSLQLKSYQSK